MSERWARTMLATYRWAGAVAYPFIGGYVAWRTSKGKEEHSRRRERYGRAGRPRPEGPLIWIHAASVGETIAVIPLIERLHGYGINIVLTTGTVTSAQVARERMGESIIHQYVPLDLKPAISRFLEHWAPDLAVMVESEIWPMTILELGARRVPQVLVNARLSDRSFAGWQKRSFLAEALFENLAHVIAQSEVDAERFHQLGARPVSVSGNLKGDTVEPPVNREELARVSAEIGRRQVWAAISTHDGEEDAAIEVHQRLRTRHPDLLTIIVPRHPERGDAIEAACVEAGLSVARRSAGDQIAPGTDIFLGDTIGEMGLYLRLTEIAFVGRSLTGTGGQNPLEPAMLETAVLSGRNVENFREAYQKLAQSGGARFVRDKDVLAGAVSYLLTNDAERHKMMEAGRTTVEGMRGALSCTLQLLEPFINPLIVQARLEASADQRR